MITARPLHGGVWRSYADHRMATAGAIVGLRVAGVEVEDIGTTAKTLPAFPADVGRHAGGRLSPREYDESDVRVRPGRGSRPRTKTRPDHADAQEAMVVTVDRGRWGCALGRDPDRVVTAMRARELGRTPIVVGDDVGIVGDCRAGRTRWRASSGAVNGERCCGAPPMTPTPASGWSSPTPINC